jgi:tRNA pseudouridine55 synthase
VEGVLVIHKEKNMTSHDVVGRLRRILKTKKIGHAGTLDPMATGVLVIGVGRATKLLQFLTAQTKVYRATLTLGFSTTTYDLEGETVEKKDYQNDVSEAMVLETLHSFLGDSKQIPPIYSAIKKDGKPLYEYAREGKEVEIEERDIHISRIDLVSFEHNEITFDVVCSKGTYIRSLCVDIASKLNYPGVMSSLLRIQSGDFTLEDAVYLKDVEEGNFKMIDIDHALDLPKLVVEDANIVFHGKKINQNLDHEVAVYDKEGHLLAVYGPDGNGQLKSIRGLWS